MSTERARKFVQAKAPEMREEAAKIGILRSVSASESAKWLREIAAELEEAAK